MCIGRAPPVKTGRCTDPACSTAIATGELYVCFSPDWRPENTATTRGYRILHITFD